MPMTDAEMDALFRKHVPRNEWHIDPRAPFVGSRFYAFARELEHHALAAGLLLGASDPIRPATGAAEAEPKSGRSGLSKAGRALFGWIVGI
jgi:hypothetical protein